MLTAAPLTSAGIVDNRVANIGIGGCATFTDCNWMARKGIGSAVRVCVYSWHASRTFKNATTHKMWPVVPGCKCTTTYDLAALLLPEGIGNPADLGHDWYTHMHM